MRYGTIAVFLAAGGFACTGTDTGDDGGGTTDADTDTDTDTDTDVDTDTDTEDTDVATDTDTDTDITGGVAQFIYSMTNAADGNEIVQLEADASDGSLSIVNAFATNGNGTGEAELPSLTVVDGIDPLVSQGSLARVGDHLMAVNAGSQSVTVFDVADDGTLVLTDVEPVSAYPVTIASWEDHVFVGMSGGPDKVAGVAHFMLEATGDLTSAGPDLALATPSSHPADMLVTPDGLFLVASELLDDTIAVWPLVYGEPGAVVRSPSNGIGPFGMRVAEGILVVTEAAGGAVGLGSVSSYAIDYDGSLDLVAASVPNGQTGTCWIQVTEANNVIITSNTDSDTLSTYTIGFDGYMALIAGDAATPGEAPIDIAIAPLDERLYLLLGATGEVVAFDVDQYTGALTGLGTSSGLGLPTLGSQGLVAW